MKNKNNILVTLLLILVSYSCVSKSSLPLKYMKMYEDYDYSKFRNKNIFIRDYDIHQNPIIFIQDGGHDDICGKQFVMTYNKKTSEIIQIIDDIPDSCNIDDNRNKDIGKLFAMQNIHELYVDKNLNVMIGFGGNDYDLIKVSNEAVFKKEYPSINLKNYKVYADGWHVLKME